MKILHVIPAFYPATYWGGPIFSVYGLCNALAQRQGVKLRVLTTDSAGPNLAEKVPGASFPSGYSAGYDVYFCRRVFGATFAPGMFRHLLSLVSWADVVHLTAVYSPPTIPTLLACRALSKPIVWSPRGALQRWQDGNSRVGKGLWETVCGLAINNGRCVLHVTSVQEAGESAARMPRIPIAIIPNGVEVPGTQAGARPKSDHDGLHILFLGRLHPKKGIENLLRAVQRIAKALPVVLTIVGDGEHRYVNTLKDLVNDLGISTRTQFVGHLTGNEKSRVLSSADICVAPSHTENFGMVVAEALAHSVPVIVSKGMPWADLEPHGCGLWVDNSPDALERAVIEMSKMDLVEMGRRGRAWMVSDFGWTRVASEMHELYEKVISGRVKNDLV